MAEELWSGVAEAYARSFAGLCAGAVPALVEGLVPESTVLDVGCGTGAVALAALRAGHDVVAVDPDHEMAALAGAALDGDVLVAGLPELPVPDDAFGAVVASFVLNHVDDPQAGASELARVTAPGGLVRTTIWGSAPAPQAVMWGALLDETGAVRPEMPRLPADRDYERSPDGLAGLLAGAGLEVTDAGTRGWRWTVDHDDLWAGLTTVGSFGVTWRAQDDGVRRRLREAYDRVGTGSGFAFDASCVFVEARLPTP